MVEASDAAMRETIERALHEASVVVAPDCAGVLAGGPDMVITAEHCVRGRASVALTFANGDQRTGWLAASDRVVDQAVLLLDEPVAIAPLALAPRRPIAGTVLYFEGNPQTARFREVKLLRLGRWPQLPLMQNVLFTSIVGSPGDAGAAIVNSAGRVVALVHGGARHEIGTPVTSMHRLVDEALGR